MPLLFCQEVIPVRTLELSPRLRSVAELVPRGARLADIGTDHAYLPAWLMLNGAISWAIAADLREGPLERARLTAERYGLTERMCFRLCNGLAGISGKEVDTIVIAGMGGETIADILAAAPWTRWEDKLLILQPMSAQPELRRWLGAHGYDIRREVLSQEGDTLYVVLLVGAGQMAPMTPGELWAGRQEKGVDAPLRGAYLDRLAAQTGRALSGLRRSTRASDSGRLAEMERVHQDLLRLKEEWSIWQR